MSTRRTALISAMVLLAVVPGTASGRDRHPAGIEQDSWAWVVQRQASPPLNEAVTPARADQGNSTGATNTVTRIDTGYYAVKMPGVETTNSGVAHVTALADRPSICSMWDYSTVSPTDDVTAFVLCRGTGGRYADTPFVVDFVGRASQSGIIGYLWDILPNDPLVTPADQFTANGSPATVEWVRSGEWVARFPGLGSSRRMAHAQVGAGRYSGMRCRVVSITSEAGDLFVRTRCLWPEGSLGGGWWHLLVTRDGGFKGPGTGAAAYLLADRPSAASYVPSAAWRWSSAGTRPRVSRTARGTYSVALPGMPLGGSAVVTPYGGGAGRCNVSSIRKRGLPQRVGVRCFDPDGQPADTRFLLSFAR